MTRAWMVAGSGALESVEHPAPSPEPQEVVVAVVAAQVPRFQLRPGQVPGWAAVGRVVAAGEQALTLLDQHVLVGPIDPCGQCELCRRGGGALCPLAQRRGDNARGTAAERITVAARWVTALAEAKLGEPQPAHAALAGDAALAYTAYARADLAPKEPVIVVGRSSVTRFLLQILLAKGITPVLVEEAPSGGNEASDSSQASEWLDWLAARGLRRVLAPSGERTPAALAATRAELVALLAADPAAASAAGHAAGRPWRLFATDDTALPLAAALTGPRSTVTVIAPAPTTTAALAALEPHLWRNEVSILSVSTPSPELTLETAALVTRGQLDLTSCVTLAPASALPTCADSSTSLVLEA